MRTMLRFLSTSLLLLAAVAAHGMPLGGGQTAHAEANIASFDPTTYPITRVGLTLQFDESDPMDVGEQILLRVYNGAGVEVATAQCTNDFAQPIYTASCLSAILSAAVPDSTFDVALESLAGTMEIDSAALVVHSAPGVNRKRESATLTLESGSPGALDPIDWSPGVIFDLGGFDVYQGYFPDTGPYVPSGVTVASSSYPTTLSAVHPSGVDQPANENPARYPIAYNLNEGAQSNSQRLVMVLHGDGAGEEACHGYGVNVADEMRVRLCNSEYPSRDSVDYQSQGLGGTAGWWTYWGGTPSCPQCSSNAAGQRIAQAIVELQADHAGILDVAAGVMLTGSDYGGIGSINQSMVLPRVRDQVAIVYSTASWTNLVEHPSGYDASTEIQTAWGSNDPDSVNFNVQAATGALDHIFYRVHGSTQDNETPLSQSFFTACNDYKIACLGTWHAAVPHGGDPGHQGGEDGIDLPSILFPDANMDVRLDQPLIVYTNSTGNQFGLRGHYNLGLSWDSAGIVADTDSLTVPLKYTHATGLSSDPEKALPDQPTDITVSVTIRRSNTFIIQPSQSVEWSYGGQGGIVTANNQGEVTIDGLAMSSSSAYSDLVLSRPESQAGIIYTRSLIASNPVPQNGWDDSSAAQKVTDVKSIHGDFTEADIVYDDLNGNVYVVFNCTGDPMLDCVAQEPRVSPDGTKALFTVGIADQMGGFGQTEFIQTLKTSQLYLYDITNPSAPPVPVDTLPGPDAMARMPDWINNETFVFMATYAQKHPIKGTSEMYTFPDQFGHTHYGADRWGISQEYYTGNVDPYGISAKGGAHSLQLYKMNIDGTGECGASYLNPGTGNQPCLLTPHEYMALRPTVLTTGDIVYSSLQSHSDKARDSASPGHGTRMNKWWIARTDQWGGDATILVNAHSKTPVIETKSLLNPVLYSGGEGSDQFRALRAIGEDDQGRLYVTNYYRGNHRGLGIIFRFSITDPHVEGCSILDNIPAAVFSSSTPGSGGYMPCDIESFTPAGNSQDGEPRRFDNPFTPEDDNIVVGKAGYFAAGPNGQKIITWGRGHCFSPYAYEGSPYMRHSWSNLDTTCDSGIYEVGVDQLLNPFDGVNELIPIVDSPDYHEWDAVSVATYQDRYGQPMPTQQPNPHTNPGGACYLEVADATEAELASRYGYVYDFLTKRWSNCGVQGCAVKSEDPAFHANTIAGFKILKADLWDTYYPSTLFKGTMNAFGFKKVTDLGTQPLEADGSVKVRVPCDTPLLMAGVDSDDLAIAYDHMLQSLRPGETRTCHGCHARHGQEAWEAGGSITAAAHFDGKDAEGTTPPLLAGTESLDFATDIAPILDTRCKSCHAEMNASDPHLYAKVAQDFQQRGFNFLERTYQGARTGTGVKHIRIKSGGTGYAPGEAISVAGGNGAATGFVASVDGSGAITAITMNGAEGYGYDNGAVATVTTAGGSGAELIAQTEVVFLVRPQMSKLVARFGRESLLYWACMGSRQDGRTNEQYATDIDFDVPSHPDAGDPGYATVAECRKIARWIDQGAHGYVAPNL